MYGTDLAIMARGMLARRDCLIARRIDYERLKNLLRMIETAKEVAGLLRAPEAEEAVSEREMLALTDEARRIAGRNDPERGMPPHGDLEDEVLIIWMADMSVGNGRLKSILEVTIPTAGVEIVTGDLLDEFLRENANMVKKSAAQCVASEFGIAWRAGEGKGRSLWGTGPTRRQLLIAAIVLAPEADVPMLLQELGKDYPADLLDAIERGVRVTGLEPRDIRGHVSLPLLTSLLRNGVLSIRERTIGWLEEFGALLQGSPYPNR